jgi:hypothetical protein
MRPPVAIMGQLHKLHRSDRRDRLRIYFNNMCAEHYLVMLPVHHTDSVFT